jgi:hypothetical protein
MKLLRQRTPEEILKVLNALPALSTMHIKRELLDEIIREVEELR